MMISRSEALHSGKARYFTGNPCKYGHINERYVSGYTCVECRALPSQRAYHKKYGRNHYQENREKYDAINKAWALVHPEESRSIKRKHYLANREQIIAKRCEYQKANKEAVNVKNRHWRAKNNEKVREYNRRWYANGSGKGPAKSAWRRKTVQRATPSWANKQIIAEVYRMAQEYGVVVDHIIPLTHPKVCGLHVQRNLQLLPDMENRIKGNRFIN